MENVPNYMPRATNNLPNLEPKGWYCIYCLREGDASEIQDTCDQCTAICPHCHVDAIVARYPYNKKCLPAWRLMGFGSEFPESFTPADKESFRGSLEHNAVDRYDEDEGDYAADEDNPFQAMADQIGDLLNPNGAIG